MYSDKLKKAIDFAIKQLTKQVTSVGGNAVIGLDIDYVSFSENIMGVVATGTAVKICSVLSQSEDEQKYTISTTNGQLSFRPTSLYVKSFVPNGCICSLELFHMKESSISALLANITFTDIFREKRLLKISHSLNFMLTL